ncbi:TRAP transporter substrate-binding protein [Pelosinus propionicus]|uniref:Tripartite ATP-independent transporter solute receptor, DctP family n=1 Tax=Pelosinus propionicus DSM 13327 TaxID=1123291 RepID=A0A1I4M455_9FIRM|nr:DctP family TRAP transporter solute-binding subunit [Pelosinus propionicus]SFL97980.1 tripartite ATP-independent transporter solute receptor, DctP family [Pelosinus propionicus DSM 13327]
MKKSWLMSFIAVVVISLVAAWWLGGDKKTVKSYDSKEEIILRLGHSTNTETPRHLVALQFAQWVAEQSNGRVKVEIFPVSLLGTDKQMLELVKEGSLDMTLVFLGLLANDAPKINVIELPFLFSNMDKVTTVLDGSIGEELLQDLPKSGLRSLAYWDNGLRQISNNRQPIEKPEDMKGLKIRTTESKMSISILKKLGSNPAPLAWGEVYLALAQGTFDGQENPIANIHAAKLYDVQKYISVINYKYESSPLVINEQTWQKLPPDIQKILKEGAVKFAKETRRLNQEAEGKLLADLEARGVKVSRPDVTPFREATKPVYDELVPVVGKELMDKVLTTVK